MLKTMWPHLGLVHTMSSVHFMEQNLSVYRTIYTVAMHIQMKKKKKVCIRVNYKKTLKKDKLAANAENKTLTG